MRRILRRARRSSSGGHHLLPAAEPESRGLSLTSISTLFFAWTFGSGAVVCSSHLPSLLPDTLW